MSYLRETVPMPEDVVFGGSVPWTNARTFYIGGEVSGVATNHVWVYDARVPEWRRCADYPIAASHIAVIAYKRNIYCFGGRSSGAPVADAYVYEVELDLWRAVASLPAARYGAGAVGIEYVKGASGHPVDAIYVAGGCDGSDVAQGTMWAYTPQDDAYTAKASLTAARARGALAPYSPDGSATYTGYTQFVWMGGVDASGAVVDDVYLYTVSSNTWGAPVANGNGGTGPHLYVPRADFTPVWYPGGIIVRAVGGTTDGTTPLGDEDLWMFSTFGLPAVGAIPVTALNPACGTFSGNDTVFFAGGGQAFELQVEVLQGYPAGTGQNQQKLRLYRRGSLVAPSKMRLVEFRRATLPLPTGPIPSTSYTLGSGQGREPPFRAGGFLHPGDGSFYGGDFFDPAPNTMNADGGFPAVAVSPDGTWLAFADRQQNFNYLEAPTTGFIEPQYHRSNDGGLTWEHIAQPLSTAGPSGIAIGDDGTLYLLYLSDYTTAYPHPTLKFNSYTTSWATAHTVTTGVDNGTAFLAYDGTTLVAVVTSTATGFTTAGTAWKLVYSTDAGVTWSDGGFIGQTEFGGELPVGNFNRLYFDGLIFSGYFHAVMEDWSGASFYARWNMSTHVLDNPVSLPLPWLGGPGPGEALMLCVDGSDLYLAVLWRPALNSTLATRFSLARSSDAGSTWSLVVDGEAPPLLNFPENMDLFSEAAIAAVNKDYKVGIGRNVFTDVPTHVLPRCQIGADHRLRLYLEDPSFLTLFESSHALDSTPGWDTRAILHALDEDGAWVSSSEFDVMPIRLQDGSHLADIAIFVAVRARSDGKGYLSGQMRTTGVIIDSGTTVTVEARLAILEHHYDPLTFEDSPVLTVYENPPDGFTVSPSGNYDNGDSWEVFVDQRRSDQTDWSHWRSWGIYSVSPAQSVDGIVAQYRVWDLAGLADEALLLDVIEEVTAVGGGDSGGSTGELWAVVG